jgi:catechol 2,3-dioxygenase-like lactoylglutathione lyase family enzyme
MIIPIFRIFDTEKANEFYVDFLGFHLDWKHQYEEKMPLYFQVSLNGAVLHLSEHHDDATPGSSIRIKVENLTDYHSSLSKKVYSYANPSIEFSPWNTIEMTVIDPFGNKITFYEDVK